MRLRHTSGSYEKGHFGKEKKTKRADEQHNINTCRLTSGSGLGGGPHGEHGSTVVVHNLYARSLWAREMKAAERDVLDRHEVHDG